MALASVQTVQINTGATQSGASETITVSSTTAGNLLVMYIAAYLTSAPPGTISMPTNWIPEQQTVSGNSKAEIWYYPNNPGGITSVQVSTATSAAFALTFSEISGASTTSPVAGKYNNTGNSSTAAVTCGAGTWDWQDVVVCAAGSLAQTFQTSTGFATLGSNVITVNGAQSTVQRDTSPTASISFSTSLKNAENWAISAVAWSPPLKTGSAVGSVIPSVNAPSSFLFTANASGSTLPSVNGPSSFLFTSNALSSTIPSISGSSSFLFTANAVGSTLPAVNGSGVYLYTSNAVGSHLSAVAAVDGFLATANANASTILSNGGFNSNSYSNLTIMMNGVLDALTPIFTDGTVFFAFDPEKNLMYPPDDQFGVVQPVSLGVKYVGNTGQMLNYIWSMQFTIWVFVRTAIDESHRDDEWLQDQTYGSNIIVDSIINTLQNTTITINNEQFGYELDDVIWQRDDRTAVGWGVIQMKYHTDMNSRSQ